LPTATHEPSAWHATEDNTPLHGFSDAFGGSGATDANHEPEEYVSMRGKTFEAPSDADPTATQNADAEQAVEVSMIRTGGFPLGRTVGAGASMGTHDEAAAGPDSTKVTAIETSTTVDRRVAIDFPVLPRGPW
jgi:hypothetical protein